MKLLIESWNNFLSERLMLQPGENGWNKYAELVGDAYLKAPMFEERAVPHFRALEPFIEKMFDRISGKIDIEFVDYDPYKNVEELKQEVQQSGIMRVSTANYQHDIFDPLMNAKFRAIHDYMSHVTAIGSRGTQFTLFGEIQAYNVHLKTVPPQAVPALFTEVVGQVCTYYKLGGEFGPQKVCLLDGFDYYNVGKVEGYNIVNKELVKK